MSGGARSKAKGSAFERVVCAKLSLWISDGKHDDWLWRSAMSGGRGTRRELKLGAQNVSGDICAIHSGGHILTDHYHVEAKHVRNMELTSFALKGTGFLTREWKRCTRQAQSHRKTPMMIVRQNLMPEIVLLPASMIIHADPIFVMSWERGCWVYLLDEMLRTASYPLKLDRAVLSQISTDEIVRKLPRRPPSA